MFLANAFSLSMLAGRTACTLNVRPVSLAEAKAVLQSDKFYSAVGHTETAAVLSEMLGMAVPCNRISVHLGEDEPLVVAQYAGPRLPEGATSLPEGAAITWWIVTVRSTTTGYEGGIGAVIAQRQQERREAERPSSSEAAWKRRRAD